MKTFVFIPTKYPSTIFVDLVLSLSKDPSITKIVIMNNGNEDIEGSGNIEVWDMRDLTIYEMWNRAIEYVQYNNPKTKTNIAILNDDIAILDDTIGSLVEYLRKDNSLGIISPDPNGTYWSAGIKADWGDPIETNTTAGAGGITGYCFIVKGEIAPTIDENLKLYWGDDDLVRKVIDKGYKAAYLKGMPIYHIGSMSIKKMDGSKRQQIMESDRQYFNQKYKEHREPPVL